MADDGGGKLQETDLYGPVRDYLVGLGYAVQAEVKECDIVATRGDELVVVELKRSLSVDLLLQATERQRVADAVYVALPKPDLWEVRSRWRRIERLLRQLELGLILVSFATAVPVVDVAFDPEPTPPRRDGHKRRALLAELAGRSGDHNQGGSTRRPVVTAYREQAVYIACCLDAWGALGPDRLRELGAGAKTQAILRRNVYGWFQRVGPATYALNDAGRRALGDYAGLVAQFRAALSQMPGPHD